MGANPYRCDGAPSFDIAGFLGCGDGTGYGRAGNKDKEKQPHAPNRRRRFYLALAH
jgi:hypothetical protein